MQTAIDIVYGFPVVTWALTLAVIAAWAVSAELGIRKRRKEERDAVVPVVEIDEDVIHVYCGSYEQSRKMLKARAEIDRLMSEAIAKSKEDANAQMIDHKDHVAWVKRENKRFRDMKRVCGNCGCDFAKDPCQFCHKPNDEPANPRCACGKTDCPINN